MQEVMENEIQTLLEEKIILEKQVGSPTKKATDFYGTNDERDGLNWKEKYADLIEILKQQLKIEVLEGGSDDDSLSDDDEEDRFEKQELHILREIKEL